MVFFLIFDILCLLASLGMSVMVALVIKIWSTVNEKLDTCSTRYNLYNDEPSCTCVDDPQNKWAMGKKFIFEIYTKQVENQVFPTAR